MITFKQFLEGLKDIAKRADEDPPILADLVYDEMIKQSKDKGIEIHKFHAPTDTNAYFQYRSKQWISLSVNLTIRKEGKEHRVVLSYIRPSTESIDHVEELHKYLTKDVDRHSTVELADIILHRLKKIADDYERHDS